MVLKENVEAEEARSLTWNVEHISSKVIIRTFEQISVINSYRAEVYASLATTLFLHLYYVYYKCTVHNEIHALCDNQA